MKWLITFTIVAVALVVIPDTDKAHDEGYGYTLYLTEGEHRLDVDFGVIWDDQKIGPKPPVVTPTDTPSPRNLTTLAIALLMMTFWLWRRRVRDG